MKSKKYLPLLLAILCVGCSKTDLLYNKNAWNSPIFDENYYLDWGGLKINNSTNITVKNYSGLASSFDEQIELKNGDKNYNPDNYVWDGVQEAQFGYKNNLSSKEASFSKGVLSKLFDGRVRCENMQQKSRVQLDQSGFAMKFPKTLKSLNYIGLAIRGGTSFKEGEEFTQDDLKFNIKISFFLNESNVIQYQLNNVGALTDSGGNTSFVRFFPEEGQTFSELENAIGFALEWSSNDPRLLTRDISTNYLDKEKPHLALMLYEVFLGNSEWF